MNYEISLNGRACFTVQFVGGGFVEFYGVAKISPETPESDFRVRGPGPCLAVTYSVLDLNGEPFDVEVLAIVKTEELEYALSFENYHFADKIGDKKMASITCSLEVTVHSSRENYPLRHMKEELPDWRCNFKQKQSWQRRRNVPHFG